MSECYEDKVDFRWKFSAVLYEFNSKIYFYDLFLWLAWNHSKVFADKIIISQNNEWAKCKIVYRV